MRQIRAMRPNTIENDCHKVNCFSTATVRVSNFTAYPFSECIFVGKRKFTGNIGSDLFSSV